MRTINEMLEEIYNINKKDENIIINKTIEECAELIQALIKNEDYTKINVMSELVDVDIMLRQLFKLIDDKELYNKVRRYKLNRQCKRFGLETDVQYTDDLNDYLTREYIEEE